MGRKVKVGSRKQRKSMTKSDIHKFCQGRSKRMVRLAHKELGLKSVKPKAVEVPTRICQPHIY